MITAYEVVKLSTSRSFKACRACGRPGKRQRTFRQTINPFNKNAAGQPKTWNEIWQELQCQAATWRPDIHAQCETR